VLPFLVMWKKGDIVYVRPIDANAMIDEVLPNNKYRLKSLASAEDMPPSDQPYIHSFRELGVFSADDLESAHR
jgi:hypothetical protein